MTVRFHDDVKLDVEEIQSYLFEERPGWEVFFMEAFLDLVARIADGHWRYQAVHDDDDENPLPPQYRRAFMQRFRYAVLYEVLDDESVYILAVQHMRQHPEAWKARVGLEAANDTDDG